MVDKLSKLFKNKFPTAVSAEIINEITYLDSGIPTLNYVISGRPLTGGTPLNGKIVVMYGPEGCLDENTKIMYDIRDINTGKIINHSKTSIKHLYDRFKGICTDGRSNKIDINNVEFFISSINEKTNHTIRQPIADIVKIGKKDCFEIITESNNNIVATEEHNFYIGNGEYKTLKELKIGDTLYINNNTKLKKSDLEKAHIGKRINYKETTVKYLPNVKRTKKINGCYYKIERQHILIYEAYLNNMSYDDFKKLLNDETKKDYIDTLKFIDKSKYDIHHIDENKHNNDISNLECIEKKEHYRLHALKNIQNLSYIVQETNIKSIKHIGEREVYDIKCFEPYNNYIANGIVVHNCGKTSYANQLIAQAQKKDFYVVYIDSENTITKPRLEQFGIDIDRLNYLVPDCMEQVFEMIEETCKYKISEQDTTPTLIVWDTVAATATNDEMNRSAYDKEIGSQSAVLTRGLRRIRPLLRKAGNIGCLFINQARDNQEMYGDLFKMPGGRALNHEGAVILRVNKIKPTETEQGVKISSTKNKLFNPFQATQVQFDYALGFTDENKVMAFCEFVKNIGLIGQSGAWCYYTDEVKELIKSLNIEGIDLDKKFYLKDFAKQLLENEEFYTAMLETSEAYVNKNIAHITNKLIDPEIDIELENKRNAIAGDADNLETDDRIKTSKSMTESEN